MTDSEYYKMNVIIILSTAIITNWLDSADNIRSGLLRILYALLGDVVPAIL